MFNSNQTCQPFSSGDQKGLFSLPTVFYDEFTIRNRAFNEKINLLWGCEAYSKDKYSVFA